MGPSAIRYAGLEERLTSFGCRVTDRGNLSVPEPEALAGAGTRARASCRRSSTRAPSSLGLVDRRRRRRLAAARPRRRPLRGARHPGRAARGGRAGWRCHLDRRARRPRHTADEPVGERPRDALAASLGLAGNGFRARRPDASGPRPAAGRARRRPLARPGRAHPDPGDGNPGDHDDGDRPHRNRTGGAQEAIDRASGPGFVHVSLDLDALDPEVAPGVGTPVNGGLTYREAHLACEDIAESGVVGSLELVEVNPILDRENTSAAIAVELAASALGQSIL